METTWPAILELLRKSINPGLYTVWIKPLRPEIKGDCVTLYAPNEFVAAWVRDRLVSDIKEAATHVLGFRPDVRVLAEPQAAAGVRGGRPAPPSGPVSAPELLRRAAGGNGSGDATESGQAGLPIPPQGPRSIKVNWNYCFEDFVVGPCNELAYAAAKGVCHDTLVAEQLFISSTPGLGKTHLLQAVGRQLCTMSNRSSVRVSYLTAEEFARRMIMAIRSNEMERFKARYRDDVDILLLEDIHFIRNKQKIQDELLSTLKALQDRGAKVVFSSSFLPRELDNVDNQLASRFGAGLLAVINKPDLETRKRIIQKKARNYQVMLPEEVAELVADRVRSDVRQLESCLQNLVLKAKLLNRHITLDLAMQVVADYTDAEPDLNMERIMSLVCETFDLGEKELQSKSRQRQVVLARNTAFYLARQYTELSLKDIGERFNRRHSTVLKGITNLEREISLETPLGRQVRRTMERIRAVAKSGAR
jgi:chromosomal replication initiator protein